MNKCNNISQHMGNDNPLDSGLRIRTQPRFLGLNPVHTYMLSALCICFSLRHNPSVVEIFPTTDKDFPNYSAAGSVAGASSAAGASAGASVTTGSAGASAAALAATSAAAFSSAIFANLSALSFAFC